MLELACLWTARNAVPLSFPDHSASSRILVAMDSRSTPSTGHTLQSVETGYLPRPPMFQFKRQLGWKKFDILLNYIIPKTSSILVRNIDIYIIIVFENINHGYSLDQITFFETFLLEIYVYFFLHYHHNTFNKKKQQNKSRALSIYDTKSYLRFKV